MSLMFEEVSKDCRKVIGKLKKNLLSLKCQLQLKLKNFLPFSRGLNDDNVLILKVIQLHYQISWFVQDEMKLKPTLST